MPHGCLINIGFGSFPLEGEMSPPLALHPAVIPSGAREARAGEVEGSPAIATIP
jgi:hypothetical protein